MLLAQPSENQTITFLKEHFQKQKVKKAASCTLFLTETINARILSQQEFAYST